MNRRAFLTSSLASATTGWAQTRYDILIKNGEIRDPSKNVRRRGDVAVLDGRIAAVAAEIPSARAESVIDAKGAYVTPGLIDLHTHCFWGASFGVEPDPIARRSGVTTWVDAGTFAHDQIEGFRKFVIDRSQVRIFGFVYLYPNNRNPDQDPVKYVRGMMKATGRMIEENKDVVLGIKLQVGSNMNGRYSPEFLKIAREWCDAFHVPLMAHISFSPPETDEVMPLLRSGDVVTHCYNTHGIGIVEKTGQIKASVLDARKRGVKFDTGHGLGSFNFDIARKAMAAGFLPDTISTDIYNLNVKGPVFDMPTTMSKMLHLGMSFEDILLRTTINAARIVNRVPGLGTLDVGAPADLAVLGIEEGKFPLTDSQRNTVTADKRIVCRETICRGKRMA